MAGRRRASSSSIPGVPGREAPAAPLRSEQPASPRGDRRQAARGATRARLRPVFTAGRPKRVRRGDRGASRPRGGCGPPDLRRKRRAPRRTRHRAAALGPDEPEVTAQGHGRRGQAGAGCRPGRTAPHRLIVPSRSSEETCARSLHTVFTRRTQVGGGDAPGKGVAACEAPPAPARVVSEARSTGLRLVVGPGIEPGRLEPPPFFFYQLWFLVVLRIEPESQSPQARKSCITTMVCPQSGILLSRCFLSTV